MDTEMTYGELLKDEDFTKIFNEALTTKNDLDETTSHLKETKAEFVDTMARLTKLDKKDKEGRKQLAKNFKIIHDYLFYQGGYPNENSEGKGEKLANLLITIIPWLKYLGEADIIEKHLREAGIFIECEHDLATMLHAPEMNKEENIKLIGGLFKESNDYQKEICTATDTIKKDLYEDLPDNVKFDKNENPSGLTGSQFKKLVSISAKMQNNEDKKEDIRNKEIFKLECLEESTSLLKEALLNN